MHKLDAIVFDMDGVLLDSRLMISTAINDVLATRGLAVTPSQIASVAGQPIHVMYESFAPGEDAHALAKAHLAHHELHLDLLQAYDGAAHVLENLKTAYKLGIFTGFNELSRQRLARFNIDYLFDVIVDTTRYTRHKPDPEGLLLCIDELQATPDTAIYIGDARSDMLAGRAAKVKAVVGITHGFSSREELRESGADYIINELPELIPLIAEIESSDSSPNK